VTPKPTPKPTPYPTPVVSCKPGDGAGSVPETCTWSHRAPGATGQWYVDSAMQGTGTTTLQVTLGPGYHSVYLVVTNHGNLSSNVFGFNIS